MIEISQTQKLKCLFGHHDWEEYVRSWNIHVHQLHQKMRKCLGCGVKQGWALQINQKMGWGWKHYKYKENQLMQGIKGFLND